jgi:MscS family membrane protein
LTRFFELSRQGHYAEAAKFLDTPPELEPELAAQDAKRLRLVLDHFAWLDLTKASAAPTGIMNDGLGNAVDEIARLPIGPSLSAPVRLVRHNDDPHWRFSRVTVMRIDDWYASLPNHFWLDLMPPPLLRMGPYSLLWGQWAALPLFLLLAAMFGLSLSRGARRLLGGVAKRTFPGWSSEMLQRGASPLSTGFALLAAYLMLPLLGLYPPAFSLAERTLRATALATLFWALARSVDIAGQLLARAPWGRGAPATRAILLFVSRVGKVLVAAFALVTLFSELGVPVASLIAGLGVGGIAVALSAQKSLENLIGAFAIAVDQPFREGDVVRIEGTTGTVELIGMRSTRIRTADRTLVSIPNGKLADMRVETFAARDRIRMGFTFGLTYATSEAQLRHILEKLEALLRAQPKLWPDGCVVRFKELGESGLMVEAGCWFATGEDEYTLIRQDVLLGLMKIVEDCGAAFAFPRRALQLDPLQATSHANGSGLSFTVQSGSVT